MKSLILVMCGILLAIIILACLPVSAASHPKTIAKQKPFVADIKCYASGMRIYTGKGKDINFDESIFAFTEISSGAIVITNAECIAKIT